MAAHFLMLNAMEASRTCPARFGKTDITDAGHPHAAFEGGEGSLHRCPSSSNETVVALKPRR